MTKLISKNTLHTTPTSHQSYTCAISCADLLPKLCRSKAQHELCLTKISKIMVNGKQMLKVTFCFNRVSNSI